MPSRHIVPGMRRVRRSALLFLVAMLTGACTASSSTPSTTTAEHASLEQGVSGAGAPSSTTELKVMEFNIEYGGTGVDFSSVPRAIRLAGADVVGIEEAYAHMPRIAKALGWDYYDPRTQVASRYPILAPPDGSGLYTYVEVAPGRVVAIGNVHLPSAPYGPFKVRDGATRKDVLETERRVRLPAVEPTLRALERQARQGIPVFLTGDFNAPSYLDWTSAVVGTRENVKYPVRWPVSEAVDRAGLRDSFREVHPDPVQDPGLTWPANRPTVQGYNPYRNGAPADRVDFIYAGGPSTTTASQIVGEVSGPGVDVPVAPWPSDHRATVSTFRVTPAKPPTLVAVDQRLVEIGGTVSVRFHSPGEDGERIAVVPGGGDPQHDAVAERPTGEGSPTDGTVAIPTEGWDPGRYEVVLVSGAGDELATTQFWAEAPGTQPRVRTARAVYAVGEPIRVEWQFAPGNRWDWVGTYRRGANPNVAYYKQWEYTGSTIQGSVVLDKGSNGPWPLRPGRYSVYLLRDDSYVKIAAGDFTVR